MIQLSVNLNIINVRWKPLLYPFKLTKKTLNFIMYKVHDLTNIIQYLLFICLNVMQKCRTIQLLTSRGKRESDYRYAPTCTCIYVFYLRFYEPSSIEGGGPSQTNYLSHSSLLILTKYTTSRLINEKNGTRLHSPGRGPV